MTAASPFAGGLVVVTDRGQAASTGRPLPDVVAAAVDGGARTVLLREKDLPAAVRRALAEAVAARLRPVGGRLLVASDPGLATDLGATGVHLAATDPWPAGGNGSRLVGRSCHAVEELRAALQAGAGYVTYSPVWPTASKPGYGPALGVEGLRAGCAAVPGMPVVALGGIGPGRVAACRAAGAAAVAAMGEIMRAGDVAGRVRAVLAEWEQGDVDTVREAS